MSTTIAATAGLRGTRRRLHPTPLVLGLVFAIAASPACLAQAIDLGTAGPFAVLGASAVTNTGPTVLSGDLGIAPGNASSVTGFPPGIVTGATHFADAVALSAQNDTTAAYIQLAGLPCNTLIAGDLGGMTLPPGVYCSATSVGLTGTVTLDAQNNPDARFVFQVGSTLTTASASSVAVINAGQSCNVFWQIGSSATLGTGTSFIGNILALDSITLNSGSSVNGHLLARNGAVTLDDGRVTVCAQAGQGTLPSLSKAFDPVLIRVGGTSTLTITLANPALVDAILSSDLVDNLPADVFVAALPNVQTTCGGIGLPQALPGGASVLLPAGRIIPANGSCIVSVDVTSQLPGIYINTIPAGGLVTSVGNNPEPAQATLEVVSVLPATNIPLLSARTLMLLAGILLLTAWWGIRTRQAIQA